MRKTILSLALSSLLALPSVSFAEEKTPSLDELWKIIQQQQQLLDAQKKEIERLKETTKENEEKIEMTAEVVETSSETTQSATNWYNKSSIGGYGEVHYNNLENQNPGGSDKDQIDVHRFVLFFNHEFSDSLRFVSELELEHSLAGDGKPGEVELEQAYIEYDLNENHSLKTGLMLMPFGTLNETHEPPTFYGVERNPVEKNVIPTTWWEAGVMLNSRFDNGISTDIGLTSGLYLTANKSFKIRNGRQKVAEAKADSSALSGRVRYTGIPGLELALSGFYQDDYNQGETSSSDALSMFETHVIYNVEQFTLKAMYSQWTLDGTEAELIGADKQKGFIFEPSYRINDKWGVFVRYNEWDNAAGDSYDSKYSQVDVGFNYWLDEDVVLKADYQNQSAPFGKDEFDGFNLGVGYQF